MQAVVLVGGEGTRLRPLTLTRPKPAIRLVDRPFIQFMVDWLGHHGVDHVVMACGFHAKLLMEALDDRAPGGPRIDYVEEDEPLGTAGPLRLAADRGLLSERFLALNGDVLTDLDLTALIRVHERAGAAATLALYPVDDPSSYGLVVTGADGEVEEFVEKPTPGEAATDEISAGAYVLESSVLDLIPAGREVSIEREVFPRLVGAGLYGHRLEGYWMDIGTPERYLAATWDILEGRVETDVPDAAGSDAILVEEPSEIAGDAVIGPRVVIGRGCHLDAGASVAGSVLDSGCRIGAGASVQDSILAMGVLVGEEADVPAGSVVGEAAVIAPGARLELGARVPPKAEVGA
jgi:mannose-1-phosphate guanylyltransferase